MVGLGGHQRSRLSDEPSAQGFLVQNPHVGQFSVPTIVIKAVSNHKAIWNLKPNKISFNHRRVLTLLAQQNCRTDFDRSALTTALDGGVGTRSLFPDYSPYYSAYSDANGNEVTTPQ